MSTAMQSSSTEDDNTTIDSTPLITATSDGIFRSRRFVSGTPSLRGAARFLRRASSRRMLREPSMRVRESATEEIEERQTDWAYSRPLVILDLIWNLAFIVVSISVLIISRKEDPKGPLRIWIVGYACQCLLHMVCVCVEFKHRNRQRWSEYGGVLRTDVNNGNLNSNSSNSVSERRDHADLALARSQNDGDNASVAKHLESANTMFSFIWWIVGFYWVSSGGHDLTKSAPQLYWLCITFLAFDVFFVVICVAVACVVGIAVCCCLPCIIAILYAVADQEGATKDDIERLPKYKFKRIDDFEKENGEIQKRYGGIMVECDTDAPVERALSEEDALLDRNAAFAFAHTRTKPNSVSSPAATIFTLPASTNGCSSTPFVLSVKRREQASYCNLQITFIDKCSIYIHCLEVGTERSRHFDVANH
ncbi:hypothetical protein E3N88_37035 [Mikania micrantha]|uniref:RING-type E3 ubiquitin transferase n=1 Tax=Mikania micrantha TaxID=192012 RepID=A0A5N6M5G9_9ASTR|nr:hypothetical protein E3N88_37035 [Mikania micrantha]